LLVAAELGGRLARHVPGLESSVLVPDRDGVRIVLVVRFGDECQPAAGVERRVVDVARAEADPRNWDDAQPRILPADGLVRRGVAEVVAGPAALEPEPKAVANGATLRATVGCGSSTEDCPPRTASTGHGNRNKSV
jgi:hypothetical protein